MQYFEITGIVIGITAGLFYIGFYFVEKRRDRKDLEREYQGFKDDMKDDVVSFTKIKSKYVISWNEEKQGREGKLGALAFDTYEAFNIRYRSVFESKTRGLIGNLHTAVQLFNEFVRELQDLETRMVFRKESHTNEFKASILRYNAQLDEIEKHANKILKLLRKHKKPNWLKRQFRK